MKQKKWDPKAKAKIILEGVKGQPIADMSNDYQMCGSQYTAPNFKAKIAKAH